MCPSPKMLFVLPKVPSLYLLSINRRRRHDTKWRTCNCYCWAIHRKIWFTWKTHINMLKCLFLPTAQVAVCDFLLLLMNCSNCSVIVSLQKCNAKNNKKKQKLSWNAIKKETWAHLHRQHFSFKSNDTRDTSSFLRRCLQWKEESYQIVKVISIYFILNIMLLLLKLLQYYDLVCIFRSYGINLMGHCIDQ